MGNYIHLIGFFKHNKGLNKAQGEIYIESFKKLFKKSKYFVYSGFLHCYTDIAQPIAAATILNTYGKKSVVYKCIIPKGAKYYISYDKKEICTDKLILTESVEKTYVE